MRLITLLCTSTTLLLSATVLFAQNSTVQTNLGIDKADQTHTVPTAEKNESTAGDDDLNFMDSSTESTSNTSGKGFYIGIAGGVASDHWSRQLDQNLPYHSWQTTKITHVKHNLQLAYQAKIGYAFSPTLALEAAYMGMPNNTIFLNNATRTNISHHNAAIMGRLGVALAQTWFYFKLGCGYMTQHFSNEIGSRNQWAPVLGLGNYYKVNQRLSVGIDYTHFMNRQNRSSRTFLPSQDYLMIMLQIHFPK